MTNNPADTLKDCPFCESDNIDHHTWVGFHYGDSGYKPKCEQFTCEGCGVVLKVWGDEVTKEQAFQKWNTRAPSEKPTGDRVAALEDAIGKLQTPLNIICSTLKDQQSPVAKTIYSWARQGLDEAEEALHPAPVTEEK